ncbi:MAG: diadenylate cyclase CdaA [Bacteroidales bacterium]|nr:diadenylate cyclase CdaA [Bacteroidales bacterium]MCR5713848.1 diadenylate cyclase CdaA [Bacteroidales bacterium]
MITAFVTLHVADVVDILLVAYLLYKLYMLFKGTLASNIMMAIFFMFVFWMVVRALRMDLMAGIMKQVFSVGLVAIVVVFQPEIRRALSRLGAQGLSRGRSIQEWLFPSAESASAAVDAIVEACSRMSAARQGALIVIPGSDDLSQYEETGDRIDALLTPRLIENIFFKNSPLHDGAVIISKNRISSARCVLPVSDSLYLSPQYGLRHRAGLGLTEVTDAKVIIVSEETGDMALAERGMLYERLTAQTLKDRLSASAKKSA